MTNTQDKRETPESLKGMLHREQDGLPVTVEKMDDAIREAGSSAGNTDENSSRVPHDSSNRNGK